MGEIADLMINGDICEGCGCELPGEGDGFPRRCRGCERQYKEYSAAPAVKKPGKPTNPMPRVRCPSCNKTVTARGIADHLHDAHGFDK